MAQNRKSERCKDSELPFEPEYQPPNPSLRHTLIETFQAVNYFYNIEDLIEIHQALSGMQKSPSSGESCNVDLNYADVDFSQNWTPNNAELEKSITPEKRQFQTLSGNAPYHAWSENFPCSPWSNSSEKDTNFFYNNDDLREIHQALFLHMSSKTGESVKPLLPGNSNADLAPMEVECNKQNTEFEECKNPEETPSSCNASNDDFIYNQEKSPSDNDTEVSNRTHLCSSLSGSSCADWAPMEEEFNNPSTEFEECKSPEDTVSSFNISFHTWSDENVSPRSWESAKDTNFLYDQEKTPDSDVDIKLISSDHDAVVSYRTLLCSSLPETSCADWAPMNVEYDNHNTEFENCKTPSSNASYYSWSENEPSPATSDSLNDVHLLYNPKKSPNSEASSDFVDYFKWSPKEQVFDDYSAFESCMMPEDLEDIHEQSGVSPDGQNEYDVPTEFVTEVDSSKNWEPKVSTWLSQHNASQDIAENNGNDEESNASSADAEHQSEATTSNQRTDITSFKRRRLSFNLSTPIVSDESMSDFSDLPTTPEPGSTPELQEESDTPPKKFIDDYFGNWAIQVEQWLFVTQNRTNPATRPCKRKRKARRSGLSTPELSSPWADRAIFSSVPIVSAEDTHFDYNEDDVEEITHPFPVEERVVDIPTFCTSKTENSDCAVEDEVVVSKHQRKAAKRRRRKQRRADRKRRKAALVPVSFEPPSRNVVFGPWPKNDPFSSVPKVTVKATHLFYNENDLREISDCFDEPEPTPVAEGEFDVALYWRTKIAEWRHAQANTTYDVDVGVHVDLDVIVIEDSD